MKLSLPRDRQKEIFEDRINEIETNEDELSFFDADYIKSIYINKILTTFSISYEDEAYLLQVQINLPKIVYDTQELFHLCIYNKSFTTKSELFDAFYNLKTEELSSLMETKLQEHFIFNYELCSVFGCENPFNSSCPQCGYLLCLLCLLSLNLQSSDNKSIQCPGCRFEFKK